MLSYYTELTQSLLADIASSLALDLSRDALEIERRVGSEGLSFLTKTLPRLGKDIDRSLGSGFVCEFVGLKLGDDGIPRFLGDIIRLIYPTVKSVAALGHFRQLVYLFYKLEHPYEQSLEEAFLDEFVSIDSALPDELSRPDPVLEEAAIIIAASLGSFDKEKISPRHGPGSVAGGQEHHEKMAFSVIHPDVEAHFPFFEWFVPSMNAVVDYDRSVLRTEEPVARVLLVPKDSRGPRVISCEPVGLQYIQQGIASEMIRCIESSSFTRGRVNFRDQTINQRYAMWGSMGAGWVTLDMKEASDRVSVALIKRLYSRCPMLLSYLLGTRSKSTKLPDGRLVALKKFAPMGSALCFPVESLCFYALAVGVLVHHLGYSRARACERLKVYGDDIICASEDYEVLLRYFPTVGLMFNEAKCCTAGPFRESCGTDACLGVDVAPIKIRTPMSSCLSKDAQSLASWCAYQRSLFLRGYWVAAERIATVIKGNVFIPTIASGVYPEIQFLYFLGHESDLGRFLRTRYHTGLHQTQVYADCLVAKSDEYRLSGFERLHWNFSGVSFDGRPVPSFPVRRRVSRKRRWCAIAHTLVRA